MPSVARLRRIHAHVPLALLALLLARPAPIANLAGGALVLAGLALRGWAAGYLAKGAALCTDGPYRYLRHPLYLGSLLAALGFCIMANVLWAWLVVLPPFLALYTWQTLAEERTLRRLYPDAYPRYAAQVPMLLPRPTRRPPGPWRLSLALANREHYHAVVTLALAGLFHAKMLWGER